MNHPDHPGSPIIKLYGYPTSPFVLKTGCHLKQVVIGDVERSNLPVGFAVAIINLAPRGVNNFYPTFVAACLLSKIGGFWADLDARHLHDD